MSDKYSGDFDLQKSKKLAKLYLYYLIFLTINSIVFILLFFDEMVTAIFGTNLFLQVIFVYCGISSAQSGEIYKWGKHSRGPKKAGEALIFSGFIGIFIILISPAYVDNAILSIYLLVVFYMTVVLFIQIYLGAIYFKIDNRNTR